MARERKKNVNKKAPSPYKILNIDNIHYRTILTEKFLNRKVYEETDPKKIIAFIPGTIVKSYVKEGDKVKTGDRLLVLEAMKMKNQIMAPMDGEIGKIHIKVGVQVPKDTLLIEFK